MKQYFLLSFLLVALTFNSQSQTQPPPSSTYQPKRDAGRKAIKDTIKNETVDGKYKPYVEPVKTVTKVFKLDTTTKKLEVFVKQKTSPVPNDAEGENVNNSSAVQYEFCKIVGSQKFLSNKVVVAIDYGQGHSMWKDNRLKNSQGSAVSFNSMVDALNYLGKSGWTLAQAYTVTYGKSNIYNYLMTRVKLN
jgi:hypothetical protein